MSACRACSTSSYEAGASIVEIADQFGWDRKSSSLWRYIEQVDQRRRNAMARVLSGRWPEQARFRSRLQYHPINGYSFRYHIRMRRVSAPISVRNAIIGALSSMFAIGAFLIAGGTLEGAFHDARITTFGAGTASALAYLAFYAGNRWAHRMTSKDDQTLADAHLRLVKAEQAFIGQRPVHYNYIPQQPSSEEPEPAPPVQPPASGPDEDAQPPDPLSLPALWDVTHSRLGYYHKLATDQADRSFRNAQRAMALGFAIMIGCAVLAAVVSRNTVASIVAGSLGAVSAGFSAYISRTFVRSQETAAKHLRSYFTQPLEFSRYLAAERMLNSLEDLPVEQRGNIARELLLALFSVSVPAPDGDTPGTPNPDGASGNAK